MTIDLTRGLEQLAHLNSAARANPCVPASWIYTLKDRAIYLTSLMRLAHHQLVSVRSPCGLCDGGRQQNWWCRACDDVGYKILQFVETRIPPTTIHWHTPADKGFGADLCAALECAGNVFSDAQGWKPRQPGTALSPTETAAALCDVEEWLFPVGQSMPPLSRAYVLALPPIGICADCGGAVDFSWGDQPPVISGRLAWPLSACAKCIRRPARVCLLAQHAPHPLSDDPAIQRWVASHPPPTEWRTTPDPRIRHSMP